MFRNSKKLAFAVSLAGCLAIADAATAQVRYAAQNVNFGKRHAKGGAYFLASNSRVNANRDTMSRLLGRGAVYHCDTRVRSMAWVRLFKWGRTLVDIHGLASAHQGIGPVANAALYNNASRAATSSTEMRVKVLSKTLINSRNSTRVTMQRNYYRNFYTYQTVVFAGPVPITIHAGVGGGLGIGAKAIATAQRGTTRYIPRQVGRFTVWSRVFVPGPAQSELRGSARIYAKGWIGAGIGFPRFNAGSDTELHFADTTATLSHGSSNSRGLFGTIRLVMLPIILKFKLCTRLLIKKLCWTFAKVEIGRKTWSWNLY